MRFEEFFGSFELIRVNKVNDFYVIWTVDIKKDDRYIQVLKVWDILPLEQIARLVSRLDHIFSLYTETYVNYCKYTCTQGYVHIYLATITFIVFILVRANFFFVFFSESSSSWNYFRY